jgi:SAM-dependent methyltransferase
MNVVLSRNAPRIDHRTIQARQQSLWASADYAAAGTALQIVAEDLGQTVKLCENERVLDVAAGNFFASAVAVRRWCDVTATDVAGEINHRTEARAQIAAQGVKLVEAEADDLPFPDQSFDAVVSIFGAMFAADQERAASEMIRVCRRGKRVGLANWTPQGFVGQLFGVMAKHVTNATGASAPFAWGTEQRLEELFAAYGNVWIVRKQVAIRARTPSDWADRLRASYLPGQKSFAVRSDLLELAAHFNRATDGTMLIDAEYLEVAITRR